MRTMPLSPIIVTAGVTCRLAPLAGRGRKPRTARVPGEGQAHCSLTCARCAAAKTPLTPTLSPQAGRGGICVALRTGCSHCVIAAIDGDRAAGGPDRFVRGEKQNGTDE